jgi:hypothetical protein
MIDDVVRIFRYQEINLIQGLLPSPNLLTEVCMHLYDAFRMLGTLIPPTTVENFRVSNYSKD